MQKVKNKLHQVALYQGLYLILSETDRTKFHGYMNSFVHTWLLKEPGFIDYLRHTTATGQVVQSVDASGMTAKYC